MRFFSTHSSCFRADPPGGFVAEKLDSGLFCLKPTVSVKVPTKFRKRHVYVCDGGTQRAPAACGAAFISTSRTILVTECDGNINLVPVGLNIVVIAPTVDICNFLSCLNGLFFLVTSYYSQGKQEVTAYKSDLPRNGSSSVKNQLHLFLTELLDVLITGTNDSAKQFNFSTFFRLSCFLLATVSHFSLNIKCIDA
ncbi:hypothetical protein CHARACLAT_014700 [Characodon lateralis]|uniref:Uncharacterized protein n=1 Tax=Characodon lateralis TaxID=208331 RepID=A0ABU7ETX6_9TELE|nr:hypothetical protein [Characodon lateralis]